MAEKHIVIKENARILFNRAKGKVLSTNPMIKKMTDEAAIIYILNKYLGGKCE